MGTTSSTIALILAGLAISSPVQADVATGIEVGARAGYSLPSGYMARDTKLSEMFASRVPLELDAGYRISPRLYVGAMFAYSFGVLSDSTEMRSCDTGGMSCSLSTIDLGAMARVHILPEAMVDPWVAAGLGWEFLSISQSGSTLGGTSVDASGKLNGPTYLRLETGADVHAAPQFAFGPFFAFQLGQYENCSVDAKMANRSASGDCNLPDKALHQWLTFGVRGAYTIEL